MSHFKLIPTELIDIIISFLLPDDIDNFVNILPYSN